MTSAALKHDTITTVKNRMDSCLAGGRSMCVHVHDIQGPSATGDHISRDGFIEVVEKAVADGWKSATFSEFAARFKQY